MKTAAMPINYSEYPANWFSEIRPAILKRAQSRCEFCGVENYSIKENGTKVILTIAHLDHDKENHEVSYDRLAALCQGCHLKYDLPRHMEKARKNREKKKGLQRLFE
jgi:5-methylcytosine-specific restriction endonuclease McrA